MMDLFCEKCTLQFDKKDAFDLHLSLVHGVTIEVKKDLLICEENVPVQVSEKDVLDHVVDNSLTCDICDSSFKSKKSLKRHITSVHEGKKALICKICDKGFSQKGVMNRHVASVHNGRKTIESEICSMNFESKKDLEEHVGLNPTTSASKLEDTIEKFKPNDNNDSKSHPKELKGKEIGMHYKDKYVQKPMGNTNSQNAYQNKMVFAPKQKVPMNEWVKQGPSRFVSPGSFTNSLPKTSQTPSSDSSAKENSPMKKKYDQKHKEQLLQWYETNSDSPNSKKMLNDHLYKEQTHLKTKSL